VASRTISELPAAWSAATLERNLRALELQEPRLAERLCRPVETDHVTFVSGRAFLTVGRERVPLDADADRAPWTERGVPRGRRSIWLGVGSGASLARRLEEDAAEEVTVWERDPWLLLLFLMRAERADDLARGRLLLALGTDLLDLDPAGARVRVHPLLGRLYATELELFGVPPGPRRAFVAAGELFTAEVDRALAQRGYARWTLDLRRLSLDELSHATRRFRPQFLFVVNYVDGLAEFCDAADLDAVCWEVDPSTTPPRPPAAGAERVAVYAYREPAVAAFRAAGFPRVELMPLAADPASRRPLELAPNERARYEAPVSFVGSSLVDNARACGARFLRTYARWAAGGAPPTDEVLRRGRDLVRVVLDRQRREPERFLVPELLHELAPGLAEAWTSGALGPEDPALLVGELAASEKRLGHAAALAPLGLHVWGDAGWKRVEPFGVTVRGPAGHRQELTRVYNATRVNVDVGRLTQPDVVTMRVFDVLACGGALVTERTAALEALFDVGRELAAYRTRDELRETVSRWLSRPAEAAEMGRRGLAAVRERHTIQLRLARMLPAPPDEKAGMAGSAGRPSAV